MEPVKLGIIGAGSISASHLEACEKSGAARAVAICDLLPERAQRKQERYGIERTYVDYADLLAQDDIEAVVVALPNYLHHEVTIAALNAGKHVLCEKPMSFRPDWAQAMLDTAQATGKKLQIGMVCRYTEDVTFLRQMVQDGALGDLYYARTCYVRRNGIPGWGSWFTRKDMAGGGPLIDVGVHRLDLAWYLMGCPKPVSASGVTFSAFGQHKMGLGNWGTPDWNGYFDVEDFASALIRFDNGAAISLEASWAGYLPSLMDVHVMGTKKGAQLQDGKVFLLSQEGKNEVDTTVHIARGKFDNMFTAQMYAFAQYVRGEAPCIAPPEDGLAVTKMLAAIYESAQKGTDVKID